MTAGGSQRGHQGGAHHCVPAGNSLALPCLADEGAGPVTAATSKLTLRGVSQNADGGSVRSQKILAPVHAVLTARMKRGSDGICTAILNSG